MNEAADETGREGMFLVRVSGFYLPSHSLDTEEKEMSDTDLEVTAAIIVFIVKRGLLYLSPYCMFVKLEF